MNMQEKQLFPRCKGEDPALPWPDCTRFDLSVQTGDHAAEAERDSYERSRDDHCGKRHPNNGDHSAISTEGEMQIASDSIDPRLLSLAMTFVPWQSWETPYDFEVALKRGTIFPALDKPFLGEEALPR